MVAGLQVESSLSARLSATVTTSKFGMPFHVSLISSASDGWI